MHRIVVAIGLLVICSFPAYATVYAIAPDGDDEAPCTTTAPCGSVKRVAGLLAPGDTLDFHSAPDTPWLRGAMQAASRDLPQRGGLVHHTDDRFPDGFVRLAMTWATTLKPRFPSAAKALPNLADVLNETTRIAAVIDPHMLVGTPAFERSPFLFVTSERAFELTETEAASMGRHLRAGGFLFVDSAEQNLEFSQAEAALRQMLRDALGRRARLRRIPDHHPIYRGPYEFNGPPPGIDTRPQYSLKGMFIGNRLVALFSDRGYVHSMAQSHGNEPQMRLFVNAVHYALRHSDHARSVALRRVDATR